MAAKVNLQIKVNCEYFEFGVAISNLKGQRFHHLIYTNDKGLSCGNYELTLSTESLNLYPSEYFLTIWTRTNKLSQIDDYFEQIEVITIRDSNNHKFNLSNLAINGGVFLNHNWIMT